MNSTKLVAEIERLTKGIRALRTVRALIREGADVGKLSSIADRIRDTRARLDLGADTLAARLDDIDRAAPVAFERGHAFLISQAAEVREIEDTLRQLSNLPLDELPALPIDLPVTPPDPNAARRAAAGLAPIAPPASETAPATSPLDAPADVTRRLPRAWADS